MSVEEKIKGILTEILDIDAADAKPEANLLSDLKASSIDIVEITAAVENEFDIDIADEDLPNIRTVGALIDFVKSRAS